MPRRIRLAAYALCVADGPVLPTRISADGGARGQWTLPGGGLEWGEHPTNGLNRKPYEKTGLRAVVRGVPGVDSLVIPAEEGRSSGSETILSVRIVHVVECRGKPEVAEVGGSVDADRWVPLDEVSDHPTVHLITFALETAGLR
jgi:ADP-ribose pyrophosphatase YjhB (NUDIX family)